VEALPARHDALPSDRLRRPEPLLLLLQTEPLLLPAPLSGQLLLPLPAAMPACLLVPAADAALPANLPAVPLPGALLPALSIHTRTRIYHTTRQPDIPGSAHAGALLLPAYLAAANALAAANTGPGFPAAVHAAVPAHGPAIFALRPLSAGGRRRRRPAGGGV